MDSVVEEEDDSEVVPSPMPSGALGNPPTALRGGSCSCCSTSTSHTSTVEEMRRERLSSPSSPFFNIERLKKKEKFHKKDLMGSMHIVVDSLSSSSQIENHFFTRALFVSSECRIFKPPKSQVLVMHWTRALVHMYCLAFQQLEREIAYVTSKTGVIDAGESYL